MKILQVIPRLGIGGIERETVEICENLSALGVSCHIAAAAGVVSENFDFAKSGIKFHEMNLRGANPFLMFFNIFRLVHLIKKEKIDIIHARSKSPAWSAYFASKITSIPFVTTVHVAYDNSNFFKKKFNEIMTKGEVVIAISKFIADYLQKEFNLTQENGVRLIERGIDTEFYGQFPNLEQIKLQHFSAQNIDKHILIPARFSPGKGHEFFLKSFAIFTRQNPLKVKCLCFGNGNRQHLEHLKKLAKDLQIENHIEFHPAMDDLRPFFYLSDIVICPSTHPEAFGRVAAEAALAETPVIATNHGGFQEIVIPNGPNQTGWLVESHEHAHFAAQIAEIFAMNENEIQEICARAKKRIIENFDIKQVAAKTLKIYEQIHEKT